jgi:hypothetical protein
MESIGDVWTEEQVERVYGKLSFNQALDLRKAEVGLFLSSLGTAAIYLASKEKNDED